MSKGLLRSLSRGGVTSPIHRITVKVSSVAVVVAGAAGVGFGTAVIGDFPAGNILFLGAVAYMTFTGPGSASVDDVWEGDYSIGTTATADATLSTTDADIIGSTAIAAATGEVSPRTRGTGVTQAIFDNTDDSLELNLNLIVDDAHISADNMTFRATGDVFISYIVLGDD